MTNEQTAVLLHGYIRDIDGLLSAYHGIIPESVWKEWNEVDNTYCDKIHENRRKFKKAHPEIEFLEKMQSLRSRWQNNILALQGSKGFLM